MTPEGYILRQLSVRALQLAPVLALVASTVDLTTTGPFWAERVGWGTVLRGTLLHLPLQLVLVLPLAALLGGALLVAKLARGGELDAWSNSGRTPGRLGSSMTAAGGVLAMGALALMEFVVPACEAACSRLYDHRRPSALGATQQVHRWLLAPGDWIVQLAPAAARERSRWNAFRLSEKHRLAQRLSGTLTHFGAPKTNEITSQPAASALEASESAGLRSLLRSITPTDERLPPEALSTPQLWRRAQQETEQGRSSRVDLLMLHARIAYPLLNPLVGLILWGIAIRRGRSGLSRLLAVTLGWTCVLWVATASTWQLAHAGILTAATGVWSPPAAALVLVVAVLLLTRARRGHLEA
jgi:lipopolysaccharide export LptBFGC system permease protein LptF